MSILPPGHLSWLPVGLFDSQPDRSPTRGSQAMELGLDLFSTVALYSWGWGQVNNTVVLGGSQCERPDLPPILASVACEVLLSFFLRRSIG